jgi:hypothetical protein
VYQIHIYVFFGARPQLVPSFFVACNYLFMKWICGARVKFENPLVQYLLIFTLIFFLCAEHRLNDEMCHRTSLMYYGSC